MAWTREKRAEYMRKYRADNREWLRTLQTLWQQKNGEERNRRYRKRYATDPEFRRAELDRRRRNRHKRKATL